MEHQSWYVNFREKFRIINKCEPHQCRSGWVICLELLRLKQSVYYEFNSTSVNHFKAGHRNCLTLARNDIVKLLIMQVRKRENLTNFWLKPIKTFLPFCLFVTVKSITQSVFSINSSVSCRYRQNLNKEYLFCYNDFEKETHRIVRYNSCHITYILIDFFC